jgi:hypothetical protein
MSETQWGVFAGIERFVNPRTARENKVRLFRVAPREIVRRVRTKELLTARDISFFVMSQESIDEGDEEGDSTETNFALSVFENALDWTIGLAVLEYLRQARSGRKLPKPFEVLVNRSGDVFLRTFSGKILFF